MKPSKKQETLKVWWREILRLRKLLGVSALLLCAGTLAAQSTTTYDSLSTNVNVGNPGWATFYFGHPQNGQPGTTALVIQCSFDRAELFTNVGVYGQQAQSQPFAVTCSQEVSQEGAYRVLTYTLNSTPLIESLVMYDAYDGSKTNLNLTVNRAGWTVVNPGRYQKASGSSQIVY